MTDVIEFDYALKKAGLSREDVAKALKITKTALFNKVHNKSQLRQSELATMYDILHLDTLEKQQRIFFTQKGE
jgi:ribosome-binding protein aMBF1 (putative translation factor)